MKKAIALALIAGGATPAAATGGYVCTTASEQPIEIAIVIGHGLAPMIAQVRLTEGAHSLATADERPQIIVLQSWIDEREIRLDLADPGMQRFEAKLRAKVTGPLTAQGTLERGGKSYRLRCSGEQ